MKMKLKGKSKVLIVVLVIIIIFLTVKLIKNISFFNLKKINIIGNKNLSKEYILKESKLSLGQNIFDINLKKVENRLGKSPYVEGLTVKRKLPNILNIDIVEKEEFFQIKEGNRYVVLDKFGNILNVVNNPTKDATIVNGIKFNGKLDNKNIGENISKYIKYKRIDDFFETNSKLKISKKLKEISIVDDKVRMVLKDNKIIEFGKLKNSNYKLKLLKETLNYIEKEKIPFEKILMDRGDNPIIVTNKEIRN